MRQELVRPLCSGDFVQLRAANRRVQHLDQYLADAKVVGQCDLIDDKRLTDCARIAARLVFICMAADDHSK